MTNVPEKLQRNLLAFMNPNDPAVSTLQGASASVLEDAESALSDAHTILSILGATDSDVDTVAGVYGLERLTNETDAHLQSRIGLLVQEGGTSPAGIQNYLNAIDQTATLYEPSGGSCVGWDPRKNFRYDRSQITPTFTRNSAATFGGTTYQANDPVWIEVNNQYNYVGVFPSGGATGATSPDVFTIPASNVIGTQSQGMIALSLQTGSYGPQITSGSTYVNQYLLDYDGTFSCWFDGQKFNWLIGGVTLSGGRITQGDTYLIVLNWGQGEAQLIVNGEVVDSASVSSAPTSVTGNVYIGSDHTGANQVSSFLGNLSFLEAWWPLSRIQTLEWDVAIPVYAQTLFSGAYFSKSLVGIEGGMILGVSNEVGVYIPSASTASGFILDNSALDNGFLTDSQAVEVNLAQTVVFPLIAAGKKAFLYQLGSPT